MIHGLDGPVSFDASDTSDDDRDSDDDDGGTPGTGGEHSIAGAGTGAVEFPNCIQIPSAMAPMQQHGQYHNQK